MPENVKDRLILDMALHVDISQLTHRNLQSRFLLKLCHDILPANGSGEKYWEDQ